MTSHSINSVAVHHTDSQIQAATHTHVAAVAVGHSPAIPGRVAAGGIAVGIDHPVVDSRIGNRTKSVGHQGADHTEAELGPGVAEVDRSLLLPRTG